MSDPRNHCRMFSLNGLLREASIDPQSSTTLVGNIEAAADDDARNREARWGKGIREVAFRPRGRANGRDASA